MTHEGNPCKTCGRYFLREALTLDGYCSLECEVVGINPNNPASESHSANTPLNRVVDGGVDSI